MSNEERIAIVALAIVCSAWVSVIIYIARSLYEAFR
jgi:hypothetical protein